MPRNHNKIRAIYSTAKLLVCSPSYCVGNLAGTFLSLVKDRRMPAKCDPVGMSWGWAGGLSYLAVQFGVIAEATSAAVISTVLIPWLAVSLVADGVTSRGRFDMIRHGYRDARFG